MKEFSGRLLDVGCGAKPYASWMRYGNGGISEYIGLDIQPGAEVDVVVRPGESWPIADGSVDGVLLLQVLEHVVDRERMLEEIARVLRPGGMLLATIPFLYPVHDLPHDYSRFTAEGIAQIFSEKFEVVELAPIGRAGAVIGNLILTWFENNLNLNKTTRLCKGLLLPAWILFSFIVNLLCGVIDLMDRTGTHYTNVGIVARRR